MNDPFNHDNHTNDWRFSSCVNSYWSTNMLRNLGPTCKNHIEFSTVFKSVWHFWALFWPHLLPQSVFGRSLFWSPLSDISITRCGKDGRGGHIQNISISNPRKKILPNREVKISFNGSPFLELRKWKGTGGSWQEILFGQKSFSVLKPHPGGVGFSG